MNIFERASRRKLRFNTSRGMLSTEQLWDLPLKARASQLDLDTVAKTANEELKAETEESFVETKTNPKKDEAELRLEICKHIIASKQADAAAAEKRAEKAERKQKILEALADKEVEELKGKSKEDLAKELAELED